MPELLRPATLPLVKVGPFEVTGELGRGGAGVVWRGVGPDGRAVAIKVLRRPTEANLARFEREQRLLAALGEAEGFVPLVDRGETPEGPFLVMPLVEGGTLRRRLAAGALAIDDTVALARALAAALGRAHALGIVHRDLKPENVLFTRDGRPLVADLGLAKHFRQDTPGASASVALSRSGELRGTAGYMAPEQLEDAKTAGPPADVFALGAILHECLAGAPAFDGETAIEVLTKVSAGVREPLLRLRPDAPAWLVRVVDRCLAHAPGARFPDGAAVVAALDDRAGAVSRRGPALAAAVGALVVGAAIVTATRSGPARPPAPAPAPPPVGPRTPTPLATPRLPELARLVRPSALLRLTGVWGGYGWKHPEPIDAVVATPDGLSVLTGCRDALVRLVDLATGEEKRVLRGHAGPVTAVAVVASGTRAASASVDGTARLWDLATGRELWKLDVGGRLRGLSVAADGRRALAGDESGALSLVDLETGRVELLAVRSPDLRALAIAPGGRSAITGGAEGDVRLVELERGGAVRRLGGHELAVSSVAISRDGARAASGGEDRSLRVWDLATGVTSHLVGYRAPVLAVAFSPDAALVATAGRDDTLRVEDLAGRGTVLETHGVRAHAVAFTPDGGRVVAGGDAGALRAWDVTSGASRSPVDGHAGWVSAIARHPDGKRVYSAGWDQTVRAWDPATGKEVATLARYASGVQSLALTRDGKRLVVGGYDKTVRIIGVSSGEELRKLEGHRGLVYGVAISPDGSEVASGSADGSVRLWNVATGKELSPPGPFRHSAEVYDVAFSPDGRALLAGTGDLTATLYDLASGRVLLTLPGHVRFVSRVGFLGRSRAYTASADGSVRLWDLTTGRRTGLHDVGGLTVAVTPDERRILAATWGKVIQVHDLETGKQLDSIDLSPTADVPVSLSIAPDGKSVLAGTRRGVILRLELAHEKQHR